MRILLSTVVLVAVAIGASAQMVPDSKGRDFWFAFLPNYHNDESSIETDITSQMEHQLYVYISADQPTSGTISWRDDGGQTQVVNFLISDPRQVFQTSVYYRGVELRGINQNRPPLQYSGTDNENIVSKAFHVVANNDVTVYALNQAYLTSEAFLVLPTDAISEDYVVLSYQSDVRIVNGVPNDQSTPSQFAIVATENNTVVNIQPSVPTPGNPTAINRRIVLNAGQVYLVQADVRSGSAPDLTGSVVRADKPVAVFTGHNRALLPLSSRGQLASRDCLVEQLNPVSTWGKSAYVTPFAPSSNELATGSDIFRVLAAFDSTEVYVDGVLRSTLQRGKMYEQNLSTASVIQTSRPTLVAQYKKSSGVGGQFDITRLGDPFMMIVPPSEQFMDSYRFVNIQAFEYRIGPNGRPIIDDSVYDEQWLNVVIPTVGIPSLRLDGAPVNSALFRPIGSSEFSWAQIRMRDGVHEMNCDTTFGIYVYGYGLANSYGYIGGMSFRSLDVYAPQLSGSVNCGVFTGSITDTLISDSRIASITVVPGSEINTRVTLANFTPPQAEVPIQVALVDAFLDGSASIRSVDRVGNTNGVETIAIPGFTVAETGKRNSTNVASRLYVIPVGRSRCDSLEIENYGLYDREITQLRFTGGTPVQSPLPPFTLSPGQRIMVRFCREGTSVQDVADTLVIADTCRSRTMLAAMFEERLDEEGPKVVADADPCSTNVRILIDDKQGANLGLASCAIIDSVQRNCTVVLADSTLDSRLYEVTVLDPFLDAIYGFEAIDSAQNVTVSIDTIPGFMLSVDGDLTPTVTHSFGSCNIGEIHCDTLELENQGIAGIALADVYVYVNTVFSVPRSQFTISVSAKGGTAALVVCFSPLIANPEVTTRDSVELRRGCLARKIILEGIAQPLVYQGISRCDVPVSAMSLASVGSVSVYPQPAQNTVTLVLPAETNKLHLDMLTVSGESVRAAQWAGQPTKAVTVDCSGLQAGVYACRITTPTAVYFTICTVR